MTIVLVDDHALFREALRVLLRTIDPRAEIVGEADEAGAAVSLIQRLRPDAVLMDVILQGTNGLASVRALRREGYEGPIIILTSVREPAFVVDAFAAGAQGYALKDQTIEEVLSGIRRVLQGGRYLAPRLEQTVENHARAATAGPGVMESLSTREREIFGLVTGGYTNHRIAAELYISVKTVATHRSRINKKLCVHSTGELIRLAALHGLVSS